ncbi:MAG: iron chelate uptake ABC transporter family permease subunit, partial [Chitinophagales bacterium]
TRDLWILLCGAFVTGWISIVFVDWITRTTKLKSDTAIGLTLSVFFGIGILLLTYIQQTGNASQSGLNNFLLGKAAAMSPDDIRTMMIVSAVILSVLLLFFKEFTLLSFDPDFAKTSGLRVVFLELLLTTLTVLAVASGIQAVGVVLMAAMLITPAAAARYCTDNLKKMLLLSMLFAVIGGITGAYVSFTNNKMPTGPWVVTVISVIALLYILFAPHRGVIPKMLIRRRHSKKVVEENILKLMYHITEHSTKEMIIEPQSMWAIRPMIPAQSKHGLKRLLKQDLIIALHNGYRLTDKGLMEAKRVVRLHRLWEMYLTQHLNIASDHVHDDAEAIEHIITPEMEKRLAETLGFPEKDPHNKEIPYG